MNFCTTHHCNLCLLLLYVRCVSPCLNLFYSYLPVCVCLYVSSMSVCHVFMGICGLQNRVPDLLELELTVMSIWHHYWELNSSSLEEQYTLLTAESFIHPLLFLIRIFSLKLELSLIQCVLISIFFFFTTFGKHFQIRSDSEVPGGHKFELVQTSVLYFLKTELSCHFFYCFAF